MSLSFIHALSSDRLYFKNLTFGPFNVKSCNMRLSAISSLSLVSLALPFAANGAHHGAPGQRHDSIARRSRGDINLHKRDQYTNMRFTYYDVGL